MASRFQDSEDANMTEIGTLRQKFLDDTSPNKLDLLVGAYRHHDGMPWVPPAVQQAELNMRNEGLCDHQYMYSLGFEQLRKHQCHLVLGKDSPAIRDGRVVCSQTLGGGGALSMGARYLASNLKYNTVYFSTPTWFNHELLFSNAGFGDLRFYRYWSESKLGLDFKGMLEDLKQAPQDSVIVLQGCAHNPTGMDLSQEQWVKVADIVQERKLLPFFDSAYQGFASGDMDQDAWAVRHFVKRGIELLYAQSFSKNMGLYDERVGSLIVVSNDASIIPKITARLENYERATYVALPRNGAYIALKLLQDQQLRKLWKENILTMATRVQQVRKELRRCLEDLGTPGTWSHITEQIGMFSYTGLKPDEVKRMVNDHHIYMVSSGRINMCGITSKNVEQVARAIRDCITTSTSSGTAAPK